jgi:hypothetical protein
MKSEPLTAGMTDDELITAFRDAPVAKRTDAQIELAAQRFVTATQERAVRVIARKRALSRLRIVAPIVAAFALVAVGVAGARVLDILPSRNTEADEARAVVVQPAPGAVFERVEHGPVRAARLHEGSIVVSVDGSVMKERPPFRVVTGDGEVLVNGGLVEVLAHADRISVVRVLEGDARVRSLSGAVRTFAAGDVYDAPPATPDPTGRTEARARMNVALGFLAAGEYDMASTAFSAEAESPGAPFVEEATFWQAISMARAGRGADAKAKLEAFLARYPSSTHKLEALGVLGWQLLEAGDREGARRAFEDARKSDDARVRDSANAGLARLR